MSAIESVLVENRVFPPSEATVKAARISGMAAYNALCDEANKDFEGFWARLARDNVVWTKPFTRTLNETNAPFYKWFEDGELNASANCLDKHIGTATAPASMIRSFSALAEKPPNTTLCVAPMRAHACIATTTSTDIGI